MVIKNRNIFIFNYERLAAVGTIRECGSVEKTL